MATYHGIIRAACLACRYSTIDDHTLEVWNDAPMLGFCPNCHGETGQTRWVTAEGRVLVVSFVAGQVVAETNVPEPEAFWHRSVAVCERVAALMPGAQSLDEGGGEYVLLNAVPQRRKFDADAGENIELFPCAPENAADPSQVNHWVLQFAGEEVFTSDLTIDADPADVVAWAKSHLGEPGRPEAAAPTIHALSEHSVVTLAEMLTSADANGKLVRVAWDGGLKVKVAEDCWTPILSHPYQP